MEPQDQDFEEGRREGRLDVARVLITAIMGWHDHPPYTDIAEDIADDPMKGVLEVLHAIDLDEDQTEIPCVPQRYFYVETEGTNKPTHPWFIRGDEDNLSVPEPETPVWHPFSAPIAGEEEARAHLAKVQEWAVKIGADPARARLHEMTEDEIKADLLKRHHSAIQRHLLSLPLVSLRGIVRKHRYTLRRTWEDRKNVTPA